MRKKAKARISQAKAVSGDVYARIQQILESARANVARTVNTTQVVANWLIGREIVEEEQRGKQRAQYGKQLVEGLSKKLSREYGTGYSVQNLFYTKQFYLTYPKILHAVRGEFKPGNRPKIHHALRDELKTRSGRKIRHTAGGETQSVSLVQLEIFHAASGESAWQPGMLHTSLSWTHYRTLLKVETSEARSFYEIESIKNNWPARELERQINSLLFERLAKSKDKKGVLKLATRGQEIAQASDVFKDPVVVEFLGLPETHRMVESDLEQALINNLQLFLLELGKGFAFVSRQERITLDGDHFYVDLVFYHAILKCYVLIDLKVGKLTHADLGQMQLYVNYFDRERRTEGDGSTLGLILCTDKNDAVVKYTLGHDLSQRIFAKRYKLHLPTEEELRAEVRRELKEIAASGGPSENT